MIQIDQISTKDLWDSLDNVFTKQKNITFNRYTFLTQIQLKGEPVAKFYGCLWELSLNCNLGSHEESIIRVVFIASIQDGEIQRDLMKESRTAKKALEVATNIEMGIQNQLKISGTAIYTVSNQIANTSIHSIQKSWNRPKSTTNNFKKPTICPNCRYAWSLSHRRPQNLLNWFVSRLLTKLIRRWNATIKQLKMSTSRSLKMVTDQ